jgi:outer membrane protein OmpA-like peptidoglycan-associated protein
MTKRNSSYQYVYVVYILFFSFSSALSLHWDFKNINNILLIKKGNVSIYDNSTLLEKRFEYNRVVLYKDKDLSSSSIFYAYFDTYINQKEDSIPRRVKESNEKYSFKIFKNGQYQVPANKLLPSIRSIPVFPNVPVNVNTVWEKKGELVYHDLTPPFHVITPVTYTLTGTHRIQKTNYAVIKYFFSINEYIPEHSSALKPAHIRSIAGTNSTVLLWNLSHNRPENSIEEQYEIIHYKNGKKISYHMIFTNMYFFPAKEEKNTFKTIKKELLKTFKKDTSVTIQEKENSIIITLDDIYFKHDSYELTKSAVETLQKMIPILEKTSSSDIGVHGHTDNTGRDEYNLSLSVKRARETGNFIIKNSGISRNRIFYSGFGDKKPISDNATLSGRQKNRRVEIIIFKKDNRNEK